MIHSIKVSPKGFKITFTKPQSSSTGFEKLAVQSWYYVDSKNYGSREHERMEHKLLKHSLSDDKKVLEIVLDSFTTDKGGKANHSPRVYNFNFKGTSYGSKVDSYYTQAYYTLKRIPKK